MPLLQRVCNSGQPCGLFLANAGLSKMPNVLQDCAQHDKSSEAAAGHGLCFRRGNEAVESLCERGCRRPLFPVLVPSVCISREPLSFSAGEVHIKLGIDQARRNIISNSQGVEETIDHEIRSRQRTESDIVLGEERLLGTHRLTVSVSIHSLHDSWTSRLPSAKRVAGGGAERTIWYGVSVTVTVNPGMHQRRAYVTDGSLVCQRLLDSIKAPYPTPKCHDEKQTLDDPRGSNCCRER